MSNEKEIKQKHKKADTMESLKRETLIAKAIEQCVTRQEILRQCSESWGVTIRQVETYYYRVLKQFKKKLQKEKDKELTKIKIQLESFLMMAFQKKDVIGGRLLLRDKLEMIGEINDDKNKKQKIVVKKPDFEER